MTIEKQLHVRSGGQCELCTSHDDLNVYNVPPTSNGNAEECVLVCATCLEQIQNPLTANPNHWRCLNDSMWSQVPAVQVVAWRMLTQLSAEGWPQDLLDMLYLEESTLAWAKASGASSLDNDTTMTKHLDSNGAALEAGDTVTLTKDLNVKGANFTAKRGTAVRGISLVSDNPEQIEGRINGQQIVILTKFVKKSK